MDKLSYLREQLDRLEADGLLNTIRHIDGPQGAWIKVDGQHVLNLCSNNYLGLANDPRLITSAKDALDRFGIGPGAVRTIAGTMTLHDELERKLAEFKGVDAAISMQAGFVANAGAIPALVGESDVIVTDELNHASIIDGVRLAKAARKIYRHADVDHLGEQLEAARAEGAQQILIITDGVFSMDGDIAPLDLIADVADQFGAMVMVDDAHGEGVLGEGGRGIVDHFGLQGRVEVEVGTMSKAFGVVGGYVAGAAPVVEWLRQRARPFLFSSAATPPDVAACIAAVDILAESTELVDRLWQNAGFFRSEMTDAGFDTGLTATPITPVMLGDERVAQEFSRRLFEEHDVFAQAIAYPTVPLGKARIRAMISAGHSQDDLSTALDAFIAVGRQLEVL